MQHKHHTGLRLAAFRNSEFQTLVSIYNISISLYMHVQKTCAIYAKTCTIYAPASYTHTFAVARREVGGVV